MTTVRAPDFWQAPGMLPRLLQPLAALNLAAGAARRALVRPRRAAIPVLCVGNAVAGGAGKTPVALSLAALLAARGRHPHILTRGYGGAAAGPLRVDPAKHDAALVGDEALLLARAAPTWVARDRVAGAARAAEAGADLVILDDGFQNPALAKDLSLLVIDGGYGFGNKRAIPAGPLREPVMAAARRADAAILLGADRCGVEAALAGALPVLHARLAPRGAADLRDRAVYAIAGIGRPAKFRATLIEIGVRLIGHRDFPDHHRYRESELEPLLAEARRLGALPVTTEKDWVRLPPALQGEIRAVAVALEWADEAAIVELLARPVLSPRAHG